MEFFQHYLHDKDTIFAQDAYDEFARAPNEVVQQLKPRMDHDQLVKWINDPDVPASERRLFLTMLGVCGSEADLPMLEKRLRTDPKAKSGLDALIACYLTLQGPTESTWLKTCSSRNGKITSAKITPTSTLPSWHCGFMVPKAM